MDNLVWDMTLQDKYALMCMNLFSLQYVVWKRTISNITTTTLLAVCISFPITDSALNDWHLFNGHKNFCFMELENSVSGLQMNWIDLICYTKFGEQCLYNWIFQGVVCWLMVIMFNDSLPTFILPQMLADGGALRRALCRSLAVAIISVE